MIRCRLYYYSVHYWIVEKIMVVSISDSAANGVLTMTIAKELVMSEEFRGKKQEIVYDSQELVTEKKERKKREKQK